MPGGVLTRLGGECEHPEVLDALDEFTQDKGITVDLSGDVSRRAYGLVLGTPPAAK
ncbi:hypothetical protein [Nocardia mikamii]|uniref:hypothetical protein n=1 Tax=Nocardia mikamii TaxID=508464 RepID=UPI0012F52731|nr:hypothetical protein [Nocardia mikamii]